ncbi:TIGR00645 family protein [Rhodomicrobium lacus]|uniref:TIGR00645 family protein n=1 Tax=Rhodomicrobium lacus TaxID=2498452 RepID=UPI000F8F2AAC|nr:TIGR00645 family protein [Rhodomicrobium lacus]
MKRIENALESGIFASRWLLAPFYIGLVLSLALLLVTFVREFFEFVPEALHAKTSNVIVMVLSLVDIVMVANLVLIIVFAGYEIFVSKMHITDHEDRPDWMGHITFSDLKIKLMGTIVAISGIELLKTFVNLKNVNQEEIIWRLVLHLTFVVSGVLFALMDRFSEAHHAVEEAEDKKPGSH